MIQTRAAAAAASRKCNHNSARSSFLLTQLFALLNTHLSASSISVHHAVKNAPVRPGTYSKTGGSPIEQTQRPSAKTALKIAKKRLSSR